MMLFLSLSKPFNELKRRDISSRQPYLNKNTQMRFKTFLLLSLLFLIAHSSIAQNSINQDRITVLNYATFHLSNTTDANSSPVDINNPSVQKDVDKIVRKLVEFKPTIICVEVPPGPGINDMYQKYKLDQSNTTNWSEEINSIAFEVGRLAGVENIYGIDHQLEFNYPKLMEMAGNSESAYNTRFLDENSKSLKEFNELGLLAKFHIMNTEKWRSEVLNFYNFLSTMHTEDNLEGVEIISDFYKRNLAIYSNFSDIPRNKNERILIFLGGTHSAYLDLYLQNNPDVELIDPEKYVVQ